MTTIVILIILIILMIITHGVGGDRGHGREVRHVRCGRVHAGV